MTVEGQQSLPTSKLSRDHSNESVTDENGGGIPQNNSQTDCQPSASIEKHKKSHGYRDRAAERRSLHGGFGIGPGQKKDRFASEDGGMGSSAEEDEEVAAAEALDMSFGDGSYARKVLENMGWKQVSFCFPRWLLIVVPVAVHRGCSYCSKAGLPW